MKKGLFLVFHGFSGYNGISKKISYQIDALRQCGVEMDLCYYDVKEDGERVWKINDKTILSFGYGLKAKLKKRFCYGTLSKRIVQEGIDFIYIRSMHNANPFTINMIKVLKKAGIKVLLEIPTYPYDQEYVYFKMKVDLFFDKCFRYSFAKHIDRIVTFSDFEEIFGCPTIRISNGIDFDKIPLKQIVNDTSKELNLLGVAEIHYWHGFDRIIKGLADYYHSEPDYQVHFHIVGSFFGPREEAEIMGPIKENHLEPYVTLYGNMQGDELDKMFNMADFGIGSLARHRSGITSIKTLKNREYAARGIPFVYSEYDEDFEEKPYILKVPADETPVDINKIIDFYRNIHLSPSEIRDSIKNLSWKEQMQKVLTELSKI